MSSKGFTLIEVLVAISLAGLIGFIVLSVLQTSLSINEKTLARSSLISQIALTDKIIKRDLSHALDRNARNERGDKLDYPFYGESSLDGGIFLAFSIHARVRGNSGGALKWIEYSKEGTQIIRTEYLYADRVLDSSKNSSVLLETVDEIDLSFFSKDSFVKSWPSQTNIIPSGLPQMIEISFKLKSYGDIYRSYLVSEEVRT